MTTQYRFSKLLDAIHHIDPSARNIRTPAVEGGISPVLIADGNYGSFVYKFNQRDIVFRNYTISRAFPVFHIPIPKTEVHIHQNMWIERYPFCPDKTLYEYIIKNNPSLDKLTNIYRQILTVQYRLSQVPTDWLYPENQTFAKVYYKTTSGKLPAVLTGIYAGISAAMARPGRQYIYHNDLAPKNILVDADGNLSQIIDLDYITLSNEPFGVFMALRTAPTDAYDELLNFYETMTRRPLNRKLVLAYLKAVNIARGAHQNLDALLWCGQYPNKTK